MENTIKSLIAKSWKKEKTDLVPGRHFIDETFLVPVTGTVEKRDDEFAAPTVSIPLISALALFWEKAGIGRDEALGMLRDALREAMHNEVKEDKHIAKRIDDVGKAVTAIRQELIAKLPPMRRTEKVIVENLNVEAMPVAEVTVTKDELVAA